MDTAIYMGIVLGALVVALEAMPDVLHKWRAHRRWREMTKTLYKKEKR